ncbi:hypothetical protein B0G81_3179 [Paraburkholderia sp. BL6665CI2N2]|nr:hypothetical protein B0G81_3179 [Paraburkholderia sp. BL6665CI2N2]
MADTGQHRGRPMLHSLGDELIERPYSRRNFRRSKANDAGSGLDLKDPH